MNPQPFDELHMSAPRVHNVLTAVAEQEIITKAFEQSAENLRMISHRALDEALDRFIGSGKPIEATQFAELESFRTIATYADDADWDNPDIEPIDYESVPIVVICATRKFLPATPTEGEHT